VEIRAVKIYADAGFFARKYATTRQAWLVLKNSHAGFRLVARRVGSLCRSPL